jgi:L-threonylcarbamoyladenylate synthase
VSRTEIENVIGPIDTHNGLAAGAHASPGLHPQHYSPQTPLLLVSGGSVPETGKGAFLQLRSAPSSAAFVIMMPADPQAYATRLYAALHHLDEGGYDWIAVEAPDDAPEWEGVLDRLRRAAVK